MNKSTPPPHPPAHQKQDAPLKRKIKRKRNDALRSRGCILHNVSGVSMTFDDFPETLATGTRIFVKFMMSHSVDWQGYALIKVIKGEPYLTDLPMDYLNVVAEEVVSFNTDVIPTLVINAYRIC